MWIMGSSTTIFFNLKGNKINIISSKVYLLFFANNSAKFPGSFTSVIRKFCLDHWIRSNLSSLVFPFLKLGWKLGCLSSVWFHFIVYTDARIERAMGVEITYYLSEFLLPPCNILKLLEKYLISSFIFLLTFLCVFFFFFLGRVKD